MSILQDIRQNTNFLQLIWHFQHRNQHSLIGRISFFHTNLLYYIFSFYNKACLTILFTYLYNKTANVIRSFSMCYNFHVYINCVTDCSLPPFHCFLSSIKTSKSWPWSLFRTSAFRIFIGFVYLVIYMTQSRFLPIYRAQSSISIIICAPSACFGANAVWKSS